jgi:hypothetical protein
MSTQTLETTMRQLADRAEIEQLVSRLGAWIDGISDDEPGDLLVDAVTVSTPGGHAEGIAAVAAQARRNHARHHTQHLITNVRSAIAGDRATVAANLLVTFAPQEPGAPAPDFTLGERYRFDAVRTAAGWRLSRIEVSPVWRTAA